MRNVIAKITCPFCFETFAVGKAKYRCIYATCPKREPDTVFAAKRGLRVAPMKGRVFEKDDHLTVKSLLSSNNSARCDACGKMTSKRVCPHCHFELSHDAGQIEDHIIAIIGGRATGKGHYIATLIQRLENEVGAQFHFALHMLGDETRERFEADYRGPLFRRKSVIQPTQSAMVESRVKTPMVFRLTMNAGNRLRAVNLSFFDSAGEDMQSLDVLSTEARYICYASGIVFLLDPLQIDAIRQRLPESSLPDRDPEVDPTYIVQRLRELFERQFNLPATKKIRTPVAFVLSKADMLMPIIDPSSALKMTGEHFGKLNLADSQSVHTEVWNYLQNWMGANFSNLVDTHFANYRYAAVSSLGRAPENGKLETISPLRVEDPFLWILYQLGLIKGK
jgi:hypothetical protein